MFRLSLVLAFSSLLLFSCHTAKKVQSPPEFVSWDKKMVDLGAVKKGEKRSMTFDFTNTFGADIQIDIVDACDCTKIEFPRGPIMPGKTGRLDVVFDSSEKEKDETISINVIFKNTHGNGVPRIEIVEYKFKLVH